MTSKQGSTDWWNKLSRLHQLIIIAICSFALYANTLGHDYAIDDAIAITQNDFTKKGVSGIPDLFKYDTFRGFFKVEGKDKLVSGGRYRPLSLAMFAIEYEIFGQNPFGGHLLNVICFSLLCLLVFFSLERMLLKAGIKPGLLPWVITMLFVVHPIHTEVVANIKGRDEILSMLFGTWSLYYLLGNNGWKSWLPAAVLMFLAMLSKEMAATFIPLAVVMFFVMEKEKPVNAVKRIWPLMLGFIPYFAIRYAILGTGEVSYGQLEMMNNPFVKFENGTYVLFTGGEKVASILFALGLYVKLLFIPHPLTHDYYPRAIGIPQMGSWEVLLSLVIYGLLIYYVVKNFKKNRTLSFGILYFLVSLILVSNILFPIGTHLGERFLFMGSLGFCIALGRFIWQKGKSEQTRIYVLLAICVLFSFKTVSRNTVWVNDFTLFQTDVKTSENSAKILQAAGGSLVDRCIANQAEECSPEKLDLAIKYLDKAIKIHPAYRTAYLIRGNALYLKGSYAEAIESFKGFQRFSSTPQDVNSNLLKAYMLGARTLGETGGDINQAMAYLLEAEKLDANNSELLRLLGVAYGVTGQFQKSIDYFKRLAEQVPESAEAWQNIGMGYSNLGQPDLAKPFYEKAQALAQEQAQQQQQNATETNAGQ
jgi:tetratricopeptide (TPR) repeat protein